MNRYIKPKITVLFLVTGLIASFIVISSPKSALAASYQPGCYITSAGASTFTPASCPIKNSDDAAKYVGKCWVATTNGQTQTEYEVFDCATGVVTGRPTPVPSTSSSGSSSGANPLGDFKAVPDADKLLAAKNTKTCGSGEGNEVKVAFDFGCVGPDYCAGKPGTCALNPIVDIAFAIFRFLSAGIGLIVIGSIIVAGLQYTTSRGNPQATQASIKRISSSIVALLIFIFIFTIANFLVPGGMFIQ